MKKWISLGLLMAALPVSAHDVWVSAPADMKSGDVLQAELGYSHSYPQTVKIADDRVHIFKNPMEIIDARGKRENLVQNGENYQFKSPRAMKAGTYVLTAVYRPAFWVEKQDGKWAQDNLKGVPDAKYCEQTQMFGKSILTVGGVFDAKAAARPVGQELEIVPLANPNNLKAGELLPLQVLYQGKPLAKATVVATADTVLRKDVAAMSDHRDINGFSAVTDKEGKVNFLPLVEGAWKVKVIHKADFPDQSVCQKSSLYSTLIVPVGTERVNAEEMHHHHHH